jgi:hypothetical protein
VSAFTDGVYDLNAEEQAWLNGGQTMVLNPIVKAFQEHALAVSDGTAEPDDGLTNRYDVIERWVWYLAEGEQEVSWYPPILRQAHRYFKRLAQEYDIPYREGLV